jgi:hypothetical protein
MAPGEFVARELITYLLHMILALSWELSQIRDCELYIKNLSATKEHVAFNALLKATYDVVVKLDVHMKFEEGGDKLACLLLHQSGKNLDHTDFIRLLPSDDDKARFTLSISRPVLETHAVAQALCVHMRDSIGNLVALELFHASLVDLDEHSSHLIGIRERTTKTTASQLPQPVPPIGRSHELHGSSGNQEALQEFSVKVSAFDMILIEASPAFASLFGPYPGKVQDWVSSADLWHWYQDVVHEIAYKTGCETRDLVVTREELKIRAPFSGCFSHEFQATGTVTFLPMNSVGVGCDDAEGEEADNMIATVMLSDITALKMGRSRSSRSSSSSECSSAGKPMQRISEQ